MAEKKRKETHTIERNLKGEQECEENTKEEKREREKMDLKSGPNGRYNNGEQKGSFCSKKKQTNERNKKEKSFVGGKRKWWTRERTRNNEDRTETKIISQKKGSKQKDQNKESKKLGKYTHLKEDDSEKTMFTKSL